MRHVVAFDIPAVISDGQACHDVLLYKNWTQSRFGVYKKHPLFSEVRITG